MNSEKVLFALVYTVFSCFLFFLISCDTSSDIQVEKRAPEVAEQLGNTKPELGPISEEVWQQTPERVREYVRRLEKLVEKLPQAMIEDVRIDRKNKSMDIYVSFSIKNRKDIECSVNGYLYQRRKKGEKFERLENKNGAQICISKKFTSEDVAETRTVKFSISYAELNVSQPRDLRFDFYIYDKPTDRFLNAEPYPELFRFDPWKN